MHAVLRILRVDERSLKRLIREYDHDIHHFEGSECWNETSRIEVGLIDWNNKSLCKFCLLPDDLQILLCAIWPWNSCNTETHFRPICAAQHQSRGTSLVSYEYSLLLEQSTSSCIYQVSISFWSHFSIYCYNCLPFSPIWRWSVGPCALIVLLVVSDDSRYEPNDRR